MKPKKFFAAFAGALMAATLLASNALAQAWPSKPIRIVVSFPSGALGDIITRLIQPDLRRKRRALRVRGVQRQHQCHRIAKDPCDHENRRGHPENDPESLKQAAKNEFRHRAAFLVATRRVRAGRLTRSPSFR